MNILKRGIISITRRPAKSLILFAVVFVLGNLIVGAISITRAVDNMERITRSQLSPAVMIEANRVGDPIGGRITEDILQQIGKLPQVDYYNYSVVVSYVTDSLRQPYMEEMPMGFETFDLRGVSNKNLIDMELGNIQLTDGRVFYDSELTQVSYSAIVSSALAETNKLEVGSVIHLSPLNPEDMGEFFANGYKRINEQEFVVIGIFDVTDSSDSIRQSAIYIPNVTAAEFYTLSGQSEEDIYYENLFVLKDTDMLDAFKREAEPLIPTGYIFADSGASYDSVAGSMETLKWVANVILWLAAVASVLIVGFLTALFLHDRRHEMGIYLAMGERKVRLGGQILAEVLIVAVLAMALSLFTGNAISDGVGQSMVKNYVNVETQEITETTTVFERLGYADEVTADDLTENFNVSLEPATVFTYFGVLLAAIVVSSVIPIVYISRLDPKQILL